ncbi:MAG TPA: dihydrofolate reductase family protein [Polyangiaceae bacterium]|jgi:dihydrofolate reductase|nr:dihydrofolate reductase family protein [Polyangiaceae bacterium]
MRKLVLKMSMSIDGFVAGPNGEIDWMFKTRDDAAAAWIVGGLLQCDVHIMGSRTFRDMAAYWPTSTEVFAAPMNAIPKIVFSRTGLDAPDASGTTQGLNDAMRARPVPAADPAALGAGGWTTPLVASGDLAEEIARLKAQEGKDIMAHGGASFAQSLARSNLIDEYRLVVYPVALGKGLPLFGGLTTPLDMKLVSATVFSTGVVAQVYRPA